MTPRDDLAEQLENAESYEEWMELCQEIDVLEDRESWRRDDCSSLYDFRKLHELLSELQLARLQKNYKKLLYIVRTSLSRNVANMGDPRLYNYAHSGTKYLVDAYINECELVLQTLATEADESLGTEVLNTLVQTRKAFGRTALVLSGGSILGFLHVGVARELVERKLLPRIISGSSAGSIFASMLCIHRDEEFDRMWDLLNIPMSIFGPAGQDESLITHIKRFVTGGTWIDSTYLKEMMHGLMGNVTFQEAYNRTGRILNVSVSVAGTHDMPRLLNYLTAPNVVIWSAVVCSCSVPFVFAADSIFAKNPKTKELYPWSLRAFIDGSVDNDMPLTRLSELFNVNHFVACQVNPHIAPLFTNDRGSSDVQDIDGTEASRCNTPPNEKLYRDKESGWLSSQLARSFQMGRSLLFNEVEHGLTILKMAGVTPAVTNAMLNVIGQEYWGDITIVPQIHWGDIGHLFRNPTSEQIQELITRGRKATWPKLQLIRNHCAVEVALDKAIVDLRSRAITSAFHSSMNINRNISSAHLPSSSTTRLYSSRYRFQRSRSQADGINHQNSKSHSVTSLSSFYRSKPHSMDHLRSAGGYHTGRRRASVDITYDAQSPRTSEGQMR